MTSVLLYAALLLGGILIGITDAVVGSGSLFMVALLSLMGLPSLSAVATMRVTTLVEELAGTAAYARKRLIDWDQALPLALVSAVGSYFGAGLVLSLSERLLSSLAGFLMLFLLIILPSSYQEEKLSFFFRFWNHFFRGKRQEVELTQSRGRFLLLLLISFILGVYGGFYGAAVGTMLLLVFMLICRNRLLVNAANVKLISFVLSISAAFVFITRTNLVRWDILLPLGGGSVAGSFLGVHWGEKLPYKYLRAFIYLVVFLSALRLLLLPA